ncbi:MAG: VWA domain-containing protein [Vicinamibacterales bacterium]
MKALVLAATLALAIASVHAQQAPASRGDDRDSFRFKSGVDLINVTATVSDANGRFVPGLTQDDFVVYENGVRQEITSFSAERVPVSLGIVLDTSGSMAGEKMDDARSALDRFLYDLLDERDEVFLYRFSDHPVLVQDWTTDRASLSRAMKRIAPNGGTALYDAILEALPLAQRGRNQKKALVVISDGNDTSSIATLREVRDAARDGEVLIYAIGIDGESAGDRLRRTQPAAPRIPGRPPSPFPPRIPGGPGGRYPIFPQISDLAVADGRIPAPSATSG